MNRISFTFLSLFLYCSIPNAGEVLWEEVTDLEHGFRKIVKRIHAPEPYNEIGHFAYFYYETTELGAHTTYSISPYGECAVFQDGPTNEVRLFKVRSRKLLTLKKEFIARVRKYTWLYDIDDCSISVSFYGNDAKIEYLNK